MPWLRAYRRWVLARQYRFTAQHLVPYFFDALTAYALSLEALGLPYAAEAARALRLLREHPLPGFSGVVEDVFFAIDLQLREHWGEEVAGAVRRGLSRNDLDLTVFRAYARDQGLRVARELLRLRSQLLQMASLHAETLMAAYTHHRPAQPTTLGHYLAGFENLLARDQARLWQAIQRVNRSPLGASSLAGAPYPIDRDALSRLLGFEGPVEQTYDAVSAGDWALELTQAMAGLAASLSRLSRDLLFWSERGALLLSEGLVQGSSIMPQKRNPVIFEHLRALAAEVIGENTTLLLLNHNTPFGDANDHSTGVLEPLARACERMRGCLELMESALKESSFDPHALARDLEDRNLLASELVDTLVRQGRPLAEADGRVRALLRKLSETGRSLAQATPEELGSLGAPLDVLKSALEPQTFLARRKVLGGAALEAQAQHLRWARRRLKEDRRSWLAKVRSIRRAEAYLRLTQRDSAAAQEVGQRSSDRPDSGSPG
jgi:argininosuccinate lyase